MLSLFKRHHILPVDSDSEDGEKDYVFQDEHPAAKSWMKPITIVRAFFIFALFFQSLLKSCRQ